MTRKQTNLKKIIRLSNEKNLKVIECVFLNKKNEIFGTGFVFDYKDFKLVAFLEKRLAGHLENVLSELEKKECKVQIYKYTTFGVQGGRHFDVGVVDGDLF